MTTTTSLISGRRLALDQLDLGDLAPTADRLRAQWRREDTWRNLHGGDVACGGRRAVLRHTANYAVAALLAERTGLADGPVVDVGCGTGLHSQWLAEVLGRELWLVDSDPSALHSAAERCPDARCFADLREVPARAGGVVVTMEVIEHVPPHQQPDMVAALGAMTDRDGLVCISTPDESSYRGGHSGYGPHVGTLSPAGLKELLDPVADTAAIWHLCGEPFRAGVLERNLLPPANRVNAMLRRLAPAPVAAASAAATALGRAIQRRTAAGGSGGRVVARPASAPGTSTGAFAAFRPAVAA